MSDLSNHRGRPLASAEQKWVFSGADRPARSNFQALGLLVGLPFSGSPYLDGMRGDPAQTKDAPPWSAAVIQRCEATNP
jgi:hypothetical protein